MSLCRVSRFFFQRRKYESMQIMVKEMKFGNQRSILLSLSVFEILHSLRLALHTVSQYWREKVPWSELLVNGFGDLGH